MSTTAHAHDVSRNSALLPRATRMYRTLPSKIPTSFSQSRTFPVFDTVADDGNNVVNATSLLVHNAPGVVQSGTSIDAARNGSTVVNLPHHGLLSRHGTVVGNGGVGVVVESSAVASIFRKRAACKLWRAGCLHCTSYQRGRKSFSRFAGAREVWVGRLVRDSSARAAYGFEPLVGTEHTSAVARADVAAVQDVLLHEQVDVDAIGFARDLDAVAECGDRSVGPAASAVLRHSCSARWRS